jgi:hypothetical protein
MNQEAPLQDQGRMFGWKPGQSYRVWYAGFNCEYDVLSKPLVDRDGMVYVDVNWRGVGNNNRLYLGEIGYIRIDRI